ncbi:flagellar basal body-associated FliL family protein [Alloyangia pacifica]|uniref:Flagellar protein FliL n=1 Tax=Alloyangia pacifica TaxID=311180 RepID=A0A1I6SZC1_9RHOB|nr:flagellar basal body-associated FliL family protein [Alloyangia pacifica]SDG92387.1 flagellar FliL protein [Alloyangia pacifica]SFS82331.1 flagellar FliL protein [Alloyangia pacifica]
MADATMTESNTDGTSKRGKLVIVLAIAFACAVALLAGLVAAAGPERLTAMISGKDAPQDQAAGHAPSASPAASPAAIGAGGAGSGTTKNIISLPFQEIIVNITATTATGRQTSRFLKLNLALIYDNSIPGAEAIENRQLFLRDSFQDYLRQLNESDLQGSIGLARLKAELLRRARAITDSEAPLEFLIADLIIQ